MYLFKKKHVNWFEKNIGVFGGFGRLVTPFDINRRPRQYRIWSGERDFYPVDTDTGAPKSTPIKE